MKLLDLNDAEYLFIKIFESQLKKVGENTQLAIDEMEFTPDQLDEIKTKLKAIVVRFVEDLH